MTKTFMFTDIVTSTDLVGLIGDEQWEALLGWHDRALREAFAEHDGIEVSHTGDGFFVTFDRGVDAVDVARRSSDASPSIAVTRVSLPGADRGSHRRGHHRWSDYRGMGVHLRGQGRIGRRGGRDRGVGCCPGGRQAIGFPVSEARSVELKGIEGAVESTPSSGRRPVRLSGRSLEPSRWCRCPLALCLLDIA